MRRTNPDLSLDLTPLIDVVFLLLIFFMLSANFDETQWLEVQLPNIDDKEQIVENNNQPFVIGIDPDGQLKMNEETIGKLDN